MSWLLDSDVLSQPIKTRGNVAVIQWLEREQDRCYTSTVVIAQIAYGVRTKEGHARARLQEWLRRSIEALEGRILSFNVATAHVWADQKLLLEESGQPMPIEDSYIAATARRHRRSGDGARRRGAGAREGRGSRRAALRKDSGPLHQRRRGRGLRGREPPSQPRSRLGVASFRQLHPDDVIAPRDAASTNRGIEEGKLDCRFRCLCHNLCSIDDSYVTSLSQ